MAIKSKMEREREDRMVVNQEKRVYVICTYEGGGFLVKNKRKNMERRKRDHRITILFYSAKILQLFFPAVYLQFLPALSLSLTPWIPFHEMLLLLLMGFSFFVSSSFLPSYIVSSLLLDLLSLSLSSIVLLYS